MSLDKSVRLLLARASGLGEDLYWKKKEVTEEQRSRGPQGGLGVALVSLEVIAGKVDPENEEGKAESLWDIISCEGARGKFW